MATHAALIRHGQTLRLERVSTERAPPGGALIALSYVGVCGTDLQILNGSRPDTAVILGHEGIGVVADVGTGVPLRVGERVVFNPMAELFRGQILGHNSPGLFQQYFAVTRDALERGLVLSVPQPLRSICGPLVEPLGSVIYAHELISRAVPDLRNVVIFGAGPIGLLAAIYLRQLGVKPLLIHSNPARLKTAADLGLIESASDYETSFDAALICTTRRGAADAFQRATELVTPDGCIDFVANYPENAETPKGVTADEIRNVRASNVCDTPSNGEYLAIDIRGKSLRLTGHRGTSSNHLIRAMRVLEAAPASYEPLITHLLPFNEAAAAIELLAGRKRTSLDGRDCIKAVVAIHG